MAGKKEGRGRDADAAGSVGGAEGPRTAERRAEGGARRALLSALFSFGLLRVVEPRGIWPRKSPTTARWLDVPTVSMSRILLFERSTEPSASMEPGITVLQKEAARDELEREISRAHAGRVQPSAWLTG